MTHICVGKQTIISSDNGLSSGRRQAIIWTWNYYSMVVSIWTKAGILLIGLSENVNEIYTFAMIQMQLKMSSVIWRPFCLGLNVLRAVVRKAFPCHDLVMEGKKAEGCLNIKMPSYKYRDSHYKYKAVSRSSHHYDWNHFTRKAGLYIETRPCRHWLLDFTM